MSAEKPTTLAGVLREAMRYHAEMEDEWPEVRTPEGWVTVDDHVAAVILDLLGSDEVREVVALRLKREGSIFHSSDADAALNALANWLGGDTDD